MRPDAAAVKFRGTSGGKFPLTFAYILIVINSIIRNRKYAIHGIPSTENERKEVRWTTEGALDRSNCMIYIGFEMLQPRGPSVNILNLKETMENCNLSGFSASLKPNGKQPLRTLQSLLPV